MATEIEHKYIVTDNTYMQGAVSSRYFSQGYLTTDKECVVRVRITENRAYLTIKGKNTEATRHEYEFEIERATAQAMLDTLCQLPTIEKTRYIYPYKNHTWEIDCFHGDNEGLIIAEIELTDENEQYEKPTFIGKNVTGIPRYYNSGLSQYPYKKWSEKEKAVE